MRSGPLTVRAENGEIGGMHGRVGQLRKDKRARTAWTRKGASRPKTKRGTPCSGGAVNRTKERIGVRPFTKSGREVGDVTDWVDEPATGLCTEQGARSGRVSGW